MKLIPEETMKQILAHYPESQKDLIKIQIQKMEEIISQNKDEYIKDKSFQKAFDLILKKIIEGDFIQKGKD